MYQLLIIRNLQHSEGTSQDKAWTMIYREEQAEWVLLLCATGLEP